MSITIGPNSQIGLYYSINKHDLKYIINDRFYNPYDLRFEGHGSANEYVHVPSFNIDHNGSQILELKFSNTFMFYQQLPNKFAELLPQENDPTSLESIRVLKVPSFSEENVDGKLQELSLEHINTSLINEIPDRIQGISNFYEILGLLNGLLKSSDIFPLIQQNESTVVFSRIEQTSTSTC